MGSTQAAQAPPKDDSPLAGLSGDKAPSRLPKVALWAGVGVLVLGGLYTGAQWFYSDKVPPETTVAGVDIGGLDRTTAEATLEKGLSGRAAEPITLQAGEATTTLDPAAAGLAFDAQATADELTAFSMSPVQLWKQIFGGEEEEPVTTVDERSSPTRSRRSRRASTSNLSTARSCSRTDSRSRPRRRTAPRSSPTRPSTSSARRG
ncbi:hypothetical protein NKG05_23435 [Oerskovia sp. M15]